VPDDGDCRRAFEVTVTDRSPFRPAGSASELEEGLALTPKFDADGLVTCVATDAVSGDVLMVAHMNAQALAKTIESGEPWYYSRSRRALWKKGETSGHTQRLVEMRIDCDQDAVWIKVEQVAGACHTGIRRRARVRSEGGVSRQGLIRIDPAIRSAGATAWICGSRAADQTTLKLCWVQMISTHSWKFTISVLARVTRSRPTFQFRPAYSQNLAQCPLQSDCVAKVVLHW
jgi:phosphoribosyl-AMP cyclohydrolase